MFVDLGYDAKACSKLKDDDRDYEFLVSRMLFLTTYGTNAKLDELIDNHGLAEAGVMPAARPPQNHRAIPWNRWLSPRL